jgi:hypothetical protein
MDEILMISAYLPWVRHHVARLLMGTKPASASIATGTSKGSKFEGTANWACDLQSTKGRPWIKPSNWIN